MAQTDFALRMTIYWITFALILFLASVEQFDEARSFLRILYCPTVAWLIVVAGLRFHSDNDYVAYESIFQDIPTINNLTSLAWENVIPDNLIGLERGYIFLVSILKGMGLSFQGSLLAISAISISVYAFVIAKASPYWYVSLLIYLGQGFWVREFTQIRFGLACSLALLSFYYIAHERPFRAIFIAVLCPLVHLSGIIALGGIIFQRKIRPSYSITAIIICLIIWYANLSPDWNAILANIPYAGEKILKYSDTNEIDPITVYAIISSVIYSIFSIYCYPFASAQKNRNIIFINIYIASTLILLIFGQVGILQRLSVVFSTTLYVVVPILLRTLYQRRHIAEAITMLSITAVHSLLLFIAKFSILQPYSFNFDIFS